MEMLRFWVVKNANFWFKTNCLIFFYIFLDFYEFVNKILHLTNLKYASREVNLDRDLIDFYETFQRLLLVLLQHASKLL